MPTINPILSNTCVSQKSVTITDGKNSLKFDTSNAFMTTGLLEAFELKEIQTESKSDDITIQILQPIIPFVFLADLIYKFNRLIVDEDGNVVYDSSRLIVQSDTSAHNSLIDRELIERLVKPLMDVNLMFLGEIGNSNDHYKKWLEFGGQEQ